jgi:acylphosphatase
MTDGIENDIVCAHALIRGRVQGVYFRASTVEQARARGLSGWVRNTPDGDVEALFEGPRDAVEDMLVWCHSGPAHARVDDVEVRYVPPEGLRGFTIRY